MKVYLFVYNILSALVWSFCLFIVLTKRSDSSDLWNSLEFPLKFIQSVASVEILHVVLGIAGASLHATFIQVASRLAVLYLFCQPHWSLYLLVGSWALADIIRHLFFAFPQIKVLKYIRYSAFLILYPTGIAGEISQILLSGINKVTFILLLLYIPFGPFMYMHMMKQRKKKLMVNLAGSKGRKVEKKVVGVTFPVQSTSVAGKEVFASAIEVVDKKKAEFVRKERNWRFGYVRHVLENVRLSAESPKKALDIAKAGLSHIHENFKFHDESDGSEMSMKELMKAKVGKETFDTYVVKGESDVKKTTFEVPYVPYLQKGKMRGKNLSGNELVDKLNEWEKYGSIEKGARDALELLVKNKREWLDLSDCYFVLLGAGSAMGPFNYLMDCGANIIAVDIPREKMWDRLISKARESSGTLTIPTNGEVKDDEELAKSAGCNLLTEPARIATWLNEVYPGKRLIIGSYVYLDGDLHVKLSVSVDCILESVCSSRHDAAIAFLGTPTDCDIVTREAYEAEKENFKNSSWWMKLINKISGNKFLKRNVQKVVKTDDGGEMYVMNGLVPAQGPNYALAKRIQHWRAVVAREMGHTVSANVAPSTATVSVVHNKMFAAAYGGLGTFKPMEIFYEELSSAVMFGLLVHDVRNPSSVSNPLSVLPNPLMLYSIESFNGGVWRNGFTIGSLGEVSAIIYFLSTRTAMMIFSVAVVGISSLVWCIR